jgi:hypothetical protein
MEGGRVRARADRREERPQQLLSLSLSRARAHTLSLACWLDTPRSPACKSHAMMTERLVRRAQRGEQPRRATWNSWHVPAPSRHGVAVACRLAMMDGVDIYACTAWPARPGRTAWSSQPGSDEWLVSRVRVSGRDAPAWLLA